MNAKVSILLNQWVARSSFDQSVNSGQIYAIHAANDENED